MISNNFPPSFLHMSILFFIFSWGLFCLFLCLLLLRVIFFIVIFHFDLWIINILHWFFICLVMIVVIVFFLGIVCCVILNIGRYYFMNLSISRICSVFWCLIYTCRISSSPIASLLFLGGYKWFVIIFQNFKWCITKSFNLIPTFFHEP